MDADDAVDDDQDNAEDEVVICVDDVDYENHDSVQHDVMMATIISEQH